MFVLALPFGVDGGSSGTTRDSMHWADNRWSLGISKCRQTAENCNCCYRTFDFHFCACHERVCCRLLGRILNSWCSRANGTVCPIQQCEYRDEKSNRGNAAAAQSVKALKEKRKEERTKLEIELELATPHEPPFYEKYSTEN